MGTAKKCILVVVIVGLIAAAVVIFHQPAWAMALLVSIALALLYIVARFGSRFDPLDPRFGSCIMGRAEIFSQQLHPLSPPVVQLSSHFAKANIKLGLSS